jgi:hypothetical protein
MTEEKIPPFLKDCIDVKAMTIIGLSTAIKSMIKSKTEPILSTNTKVLIITNFGSIEGNIVSYLDNEEDSNLAKIISDGLFNVKNRMMSAIQDDIGQPIVTNNTGIVTILDATVTPHGNPLVVSQYKILHIFSDQIVGFTFGN